MPLLWKSGDSEASVPRLQEFDIEIEPPTPLGKRISQSLTAALYRTRDVLRGFASAVYHPEHGGLILFIVVLNLVLAIYGYYYCYDSVYPGTKIAANISRNDSTTSAFAAFYWILSGPAIMVNIPIAWWFMKLWIGLSGKVGLKGVFASLMAFIAFWTCMALGTWTIWISFPLEILWHKSVYNNACMGGGWDITAVLSGVSYASYIATVPNVGSADVVFEFGNYTMELDQNVNNTVIYNFYDTHTFNYTPPLHNITYDLENATYTINNITTNFTLSPNLAFPSLGLVLEDPSIPFILDCWPPSANLIHRNGPNITRVLDTVTDWDSDCTLFKTCGNLDLPGDFQIALGVVMIQQYAYAYCCTENSDN
jgi:hypothetical protein